MGSVLSVVTLAQLVEAGSPDTEPYSPALVYFSHHAWQQ